jgi:hypothetical protein
VESPRWAKRLGGRPVHLRDPHDHQSGTVPRFWTAAFGTAYADLHRRLAARYDADPVVAEVVVSRCTTFYAEPFIRQTSDRKSRRALLRAGYTEAADKRCHRQEIDTHQVWSRTRSGLALNPAQFLTRKGRRTVDDSFTIAMMRYCERKLGPRCVLENNSIRSPIASLDPDKRHPHYRRMSRAMSRHAPEVRTDSGLGRGAGRDVRRDPIQRRARRLHPEGAHRRGATPRLTAPRLTHGAGRGRLPLGSAMMRS